MTAADDNPRRALIVRPNSAPVAFDRSGLVVSRMVGEALEIARRRALAPTYKRFTVGRFELREPDYRQVCRWAHELEKTPEDLLDALSSLERDLDDQRTVRFSVEDGSIKSIVWVD
jgi:hypothetical protein